MNERIFIRIPRSKADEAILFGQIVPKHFGYRGCFRESQVCFQTVLLSMFKDIENSTLTTA